MYCVCVLYNCCVKFYVKNLKRNIFFLALHLPLQLQKSSISKIICLFPQPTCYCTFMSNWEVALPRLFSKKFFNTGAGSKQRSLAREEEVKLNFGRKNEEKRFLGSVAFLFCQSWLFCLQPFLLDQREDLLEFKRRTLAEENKKRNLFGK